MKRNIRKIKKQQIRRTVGKINIPHEKRYIDRLGTESFDVAGLSIDDIMNIDPERLNRMNRKQFQDVTNRIVSAANKRIRYLSQSDIGKISPAYKKYEDMKRMFTTKGKNLNQLRNEFASARDFLNMQTSTMRGFKKLKKKFEKKFGAKKSMSADEYKNFWKAYRITEEKHKGEIVSKKVDSERLLKTVYRMRVEGRSDDYVEQFIKHAYEESARAKAQREKEMDLTDEFVSKDDFWS